MQNIKRTLALSSAALLLLFCFCFICSAILRTQTKVLIDDAAALPYVSEFENMIDQEDQIKALRQEVDLIGKKIDIRCKYFSFFIGNEHLKRVQLAHTNLAAAVYSSERADYGAARDAFLEAVETLLYVIG